MDRRRKEGIARRGKKARQARRASKEGKQGGASPARGATRQRVGGGGGGGQARDRHYHSRVAPCQTRVSLPTAAQRPTRQAGTREAARHTLANRRVLVAAAASSSRRL